MKTSAGGSKTPDHFGSTIKSLYDRLKAPGKVFKVAMIACMRKLVTILNVMVKNNESWRMPAH